MRISSPSIPPLAYCTKFFSPWREELLARRRQLNDKPSRLCKLIFRAENFHRGGEFDPLAPPS